MSDREWPVVSCRQVIQSCLLAFSLSRLNSVSSPDSLPHPHNLCYLSCSPRSTMSDLFKDIPEFVEVSADDAFDLAIIIELTINVSPGLFRWKSESLWHHGRKVFVSSPIINNKSRNSPGRTRLNTASFRELGPPDLCHVVKTSGPKSAPKDVSARFLLGLYCRLNFAL